MKTNKIFFFQISFINLPLMIFLGIFRFEVFYLKASTFFNQKKISNFLNYLNINKIDFNNADHSISQKYVKMKKNSHLISKKIADRIIIKIWSKELEKIFLKKTFLKIFLTNYLNSRAFEMLMIFEFAKRIRHDRKNLYFWMNKNMISKEISKNYTNFIFIKPVFLNFFTDLIEKIFQFITITKNRFLKIKFNKKEKKSKSLYNLKKFNTIYFVSGGIVGASGNYINFKNFFFSKKTSSPINKNNIIICETSKKLGPSSVYYFSKLKLKFFYWHNRRVFKLFKYSFLIFAKIIFRPSLISDLSSSIRVCWAILEVKSHIKALDDFSNLKNAIVENEFQFQTTLAIALKHRGIKIHCISKRLLYPAQKHQFIADNYFAIGKQTISDLKHQFYKKINPIIVGGKESMSLRKIPNYLSKFNKSYRLTCLVLDYHSNEDWYKSSISPLVNWSENKKYYELILRISKNYPKILFVLKSKNYDWTRISFFSDTLKKIKKQKNLILFSNKVRMTNYEMTQKADFSIARWTSLVDDFLMNNKPVIIYDNPPFISGTIKYPPKIISYNFEDLVKKIQKIEKNYKNYNSQLNSFRKRHYAKFDLRRFQRSLIKVLK